MLLLSFKKAKIPYLVKGRIFSAHLKTVEATYTSPESTGRQKHSADTRRLSRDINLPLALCFVQPINIDLTNLVLSH